MKVCLVLIVVIMVAALCTPCVGAPSASLTSAQKTSIGKIVEETYGKTVVASGGQELDLYNAVAWSDDWTANQTAGQRFTPLSSLPESQRGSLENAVFNSFSCYVTYQRGFEMEMKLWKWTGEDDPPGWLSTVRSTPIQTWRIRKESGSGVEWLSFPLNAGELAAAGPHPMDGSYYWQAKVSWVEPGGASALNVRATGRDASPAGADNSAWHDLGDKKGWSYQTQLSVSTPEPATVSAAEQPKKGKGVDIKFLTEQVMSVLEIISPKQAAKVKNLADGLKLLEGAKHLSPEYIGQLVAMFRSLNQGRSTEVAAAHAYLVTASAGSNRPEANTSSPGQKAAVDAKAFLGQWVTMDGSSERDTYSWNPQASPLESGSMSAGDSVEFKSKGGRIWVSHWLFEGLSKQPDDGWIPLVADGSNLRASAYRVDLWGNNSITNEFQTTTYKMFDVDAALVGDRLHLKFKMDYCSRSDGQRMTTTEFELWCRRVKP